ALADRGGDGLAQGRGGVVEQQLGVEVKGGLVAVQAGDVGGHRVALTEAERARVDRLQQRLEAALGVVQGLLALGAGASKDPVGGDAAEHGDDVGHALANPDRSVCIPPGGGTSLDVMSTATSIDPSADLVTLLRQLVDIESVSGNEDALADQVEAVL